MATLSDAGPPPNNRKQNEQNPGRRAAGGRRRRRRRLSRSFSRPPPPCLSLPPADTRTIQSRSRATQSQGSRPRPLVRSWTQYRRVLLFVRIITPREHTPSSLPSHLSLKTKAPLLTPPPHPLPFLLVRGHHGMQARTLQHHPSRNIVSSPPSSSTLSRAAVREKDIPSLLAPQKNFEPHANVKPLENDPPSEHHHQQHQRLLRSKSLPRRANNRSTATTVTMAQGERREQRRNPPPPPTLHSSKKKFSRDRAALTPSLCPPLLPPLPTHTSHPHSPARRPHLREARRCG